MRQVSVVIPSFNRLRQVGRAIESAFRQTYQPFEVILVDDGSVDGTCEWVSRVFPSVKILRKLENVGGSAARNLGARAAKGDYLAFLDSDDEWLDGHLSTAVCFLEANDVSGIFCSFYLDDGTARKLVEFDHEGVNAETLPDFILGNRRFDARTSTFVFKRSCFLEVGFDERLRKHQDWDLAINFNLKYRFQFNNQPTVVIHLGHSGNRISSKMNPEASRYFVDKNRNLLSSQAIFWFGLKQAYRSERLGESEAIRKSYLDICRLVVPDCPWKMRFLFTSVSMGLPVSYVYRLRSFRNFF